jgi:NADH-quinone oxidoreductase subunit M
LSLLISLPLIGAVVILALPRGKVSLQRTLAVFSSGLAFALSVWLGLRFDRTTAALQWVERLPWIPQFNIHYQLGVDGLSGPLVLLTTLLSLLSIIASFNIETRVKEYFFWFLMLEAGMLGVFLATDFFLFYVFWEITLVPMYFLIGIWGGPQKEYAAIKFFLYTLFGSVGMLLAMIALYFTSNPHTFDMMELIRQSGRFSALFQGIVFLALFLAFAIKVPVFPFHTWLPLAHTEAPTAVSVILAGVLLKMGAYGILRISTPMLPVATKAFLPILVVLAFINIVYGAACALVQKDIKKMVAYSSVNHMGYCLLGMTAVIGANASAGLSGAILQMVTHGIVTGSLFLLVGVIYDRAHTRDIDAFGGLGARVPILAGIMTVQAMASLGLPGLAGFISEFLCFLGAYGVAAQRIWVMLSVLGVLLTAAFFLKMLKSVFLGEFNKRWENRFPDMTARELVSVLPLVALTFWLGVAPGAALRMMNATVTNLVRIFGGS